MADFIKSYEKVIKSGKYSEASWQTMTEQGLYAYPKAHAVVLAYLAYTTAYLKTHFPEEYTRAALCVAVSEE